MDKEIKMPDTKKYEDKVHQAYQAIQKEDGMTNANVLELQKLLKYYPEHKDLELDGFYGKGTIEAVESFYGKHYWTPERRLEKAQDLYGEKYIMQSEMDAMREEAERNKRDENMERAFPDTAAKEAGY